MKSTFCIWPFDHTNKYESFNTFIIMSTCQTSLCLWKNDNCTFAFTKTSNWRIYSTSSNRLPCIHTSTIFLYMCYRLLPELYMRHEVNNWITIFYYRFRIRHSWITHIIRITYSAKLWYEKSFFHCTSFSTVLHCDSHYAWRPKLTIQQCYTTVYLRMNKIWERGMLLVFFCRASLLWHFNSKMMPAGTRTLSYPIPQVLCIWFKYLSTGVLYCGILFLYTWNTCDLNNVQQVALEIHQ